MQTIGAGEVTSDMLPDVLASFGITFTHSCRSARENVVALRNFQQNGKQLAYRLQRPSPYHCAFPIAGTSYTLRESHPVSISQSPIGNFLYFSKPLKGYFDYSEVRELL